MNNSLQKENARLKADLDIKITADIKTEMSNAEGQMEVETLALHITEL